MSERWSIVWKQIEDEIEKMDTTRLPRLLENRTVKDRYVRFK